MLPVDIVHVLEENLCIDFSDDSGKQSIRFLSIVSHKLICKLRKYSFNSFYSFGKPNEYVFSVLLVFAVNSAQLIQRMELIPIVINFLRGTIAEVVSFFRAGPSHFIVSATC